MMNANAIYPKAKQLTGSVQRPIVQRPGGRGSPRRRFAKMHDMETKYEENKAATNRLVTAKNVSLEPRFRRAIITGMVSETMTALRGIMVPAIDLTCQSQQSAPEAM